MIALYYTAPRNPVIEGHRVKTVHELVIALVQINPNTTIREALDQWGRIQK